ncbi:hypothetical protein GLOIN_2v1569824 [Rhizophagus clarus]|uniref:Uncharacterized protein n=1 Tax=Rhizophagus clarus TaxID=94130 RepID=A0A8H3LL91_9GLOM|nr:hypothetical protein GLOIN_2v1569824 [Rhizophagus clarus]
MKKLYSCITFVCTAFFYSFFPYPVAKHFTTLFLNKLLPSCFTFIFYFLYIREQTKLYKKQISELKGRAEECGGPLYRQNYRGPPFDTGTEIERQNAQLIYQNQSLNEENAALTAIVKEYEQSLKTIMMKFRYQAYEIQQSKLEMQRSYEILLEEQRATTAQVLSENALLQSHLSNLGNLVREAYNAQSDSETDILVNSLITENQGLRQMLKIANGTGFSTSSSVVQEEEDRVTGQGQEG